ncbi:MAG: dTDP-4-dehydrorhamnose reductase [Schaedlerella sp.]|nr:dTDP-4-dehydrorhamnose reductase [Schaedlerella sp.]
MNTPCEKSMEKIWISGADGHVGRVLIKMLDRLQYKFIGTDKTEVDITDKEAVHMYCMLNRPDIIINCSGLTDLEECEKNPDLAYAVNAVGVRNLAQEAEEIGAKLIQLSTDDVFGTTDSEARLNEFDPIVPRSIYGKSKAAGEKFVRTLMTRYVIVRSSWVYGTGKDYLNTVLKAAENGGSFKASINQFSSPTSAKELSKVIIALIENDVYGTYHAVCRGVCSRYEYAKEILKLTNNEEKLSLIPVADETDSRPKYSVLDNMMIRISGLEEPKEWKDALKEYLKEGGIA